MYRLIWKQINTRDKRFLRKILFLTQIIRILTKAFEINVFQATLQDAFWIVQMYFGGHWMWWSLHDIANTLESKILRQTPKKLTEIE